MVRGLSNTDGAAFISARGEAPFRSVDEVRKRAKVPAASLLKIARAEGFRPALGLARREAFWAIRALRDRPLPLFDEPGEGTEPRVALTPMSEGREVVEDYGHLGLTLRRHPLAFLRDDLRRQGYATCCEAGAARDGRFLKTAGVVLVRQKPGSAKGVMFITFEDETGVCNLVIWPKLYEAQRRVILAASMLGFEGRIQREGEVVNLIAHKLHNLTGALAGMGERHAPLKIVSGRGDEVAHGSSPDARDGKATGMRARDIYIPDLHIDTLKVKPRNFR